MIKWKSGYHYKGNAEKCYVELEKVRKRDGCITPKAVVKQARPKRNPLHSEFTWDDQEAAKQFRLEQARRVVRSIEIVQEERPDESVRAFHVVTTSVDDEAGRAYMSTEDIMRDPVLRAELLDRAFRDMEAFQKRYQGLVELADVFSAMDKAAA